MMRHLLTAILVFLTASAFGLDIITRDGKIFSDCTVRKVERDGVRIMHRDGTAFLDFDELPSAIQKQYGWTADKSATRKADKSAAAEAQRVAVENMRREQAERAASIAKEQESERVVTEQQSKDGVSERRIPIGETSNDQDLALWLKWGFCAVLAIASLLWLKKLRAKHNDKLERRRRAEEAQRYFELVKARNAFRTVTSRIALKDGEFAFYEAGSAFHERRAVRHRGSSVSSQEWQKLDSGALTITNKRIIFKGSSAIKDIKLDKMMSLKPWFEGVEVFVEKKQKGMMFTASNPILVSMLIQYFADGGSPGNLPEPKHGTG